MLYDAFVCHAGEDKEAIARPVAKGLATRGARVWFDETILTLGDSLPKSIDAGLAESEWGVVILSPAFFAKNWPQRELDALAAREARDGRKVILPVWHNVDDAYVSQFSPTLASKFAISSSRGVDAVVDAISLAMSVAPGAVPHVPPPRPAFKRAPDGTYSYRVIAQGFLDENDEFRRRLAKDFNVRGISSASTPSTGWARLQFSYQGPYAPDRIELLAMKYGLAVQTEAPDDEQ